MCSGVRCRCARCHGARHDTCDSCRRSSMICRLTLAPTSWISCVSWFNVRRVFMLSMLFSVSGGELCDSSAGKHLVCSTWFFNMLLRPCRVGTGHPSSPLVHLLPHLFPFLLFPFFHWLYLFSFFVHPFPFYQNSPSPFPGRRS